MSLIRIIKALVFIHFVPRQRRRSVRFYAFIKLKNQLFQCLDWVSHGATLNIMPILNRAFKHLFDRLTTDMAPHDQVRLIFNSHQLDRPISLPFLPREKLTPERFLAAVERSFHLR